MPKFLTLSGCFSWIYRAKRCCQPDSFLYITLRIPCPAHTLFKLTISPLAFLIFFSLARKYQKRLFAMTSLGAKIRMR